MAIDLMQPFRDAAKRAAEQLRAGQSVDIEISAPLVIDPEVAEESAFSIGALIVTRIREGLEGSTLQVTQATKERRARALAEDARRSPTGGAVKAARYPAGFVPNPDGAYGEDSGYLRTALTLNIARGKSDVFAGIPKNRAKAAFVLRRLSPLARGGAELATAVRESLRERIKTIVRKTLRKALREEGLTGRIV